MKKSLRRFLVLVIATVALLALAWGITSLIQFLSAGSGVTVTPPVAPVQSAASQPAAESEPAVDNTEWNFIGPVAQDPAAMQIVSPDYRMLCLPENGRVDMSYFDTATFVGDSITQGLQGYNTIPNAHYCAYKSIGPKGIIDGSVWKRADGTEEIPLDAIVASQPDNVYILMGTNAMVGITDNDILIEYYANMLDAIKGALHPDVGIYVQSITPIIAGTPRFDLARIHTLNNMLAKLASEKGVYFLDLHEAVAGDDGYLRPEFGSARDGYHLTPAGYDAWADYLVTHTAYHPRNPYLEGSPYYSQVPVPTPAA